MKAMPCMVCGKENEILYKGECPDCFAARIKADNQCRDYFNGILGKINQEIQKNREAVEVVEAMKILKAREEQANR